MWEREKRGRSLDFAWVTIWVVISFNKLENSGREEFEVKVAIMGSDVSFRQ